MGTVLMVHGRVPDCNFTGGGYSFAVTSFLSYNEAVCSSYFEYYETGIYTTVVLEELHTPFCATIQGVLALEAPSLPSS